MTATKTPQSDDELARLRARVQELEAEVARKERDVADRAERVSDDFRRDADRRYQPTQRREARYRDRGARYRASANRERDDERRGAAFDDDRDRDERSDTRRETRRVASDVSDTTWRKSEIATRAIRGMTLASLDAFRLFADSLSWLATGALDRNRADDRDTSVNELNRRLPSDLSASFADAVDDWLDIPARAASRFADTYYEGEYRRSDRKRDDRDDRGSRPKEEGESGVEVEFRASRTSDERPPNKT